MKGAHCSTLKQDQVDGRWKTTANDWQARFNKTSAEGLELAKGAQSLTSKPVGGSSVAPVVTGTGQDQRLLYRNVWPGVDLEYAINGSGVKENIIVKSRAAATQFNFKLSGSSIAPYDAHPGWYKLTGELGEFILPAPTVATKTEGVVGADPYVKQAATSDGLAITLDQKWLTSQPTDAFPVVIDPTFVSQSGASGNYVNFKSDGFICYPGQGCGNSTGSISNNYWRFAYHVDYPQFVGPGKYLIEANFHVEMPNCTTPSYGTCDGHYIRTGLASSNTCFSCIYQGTPQVDHGGFLNDGYFQVRLRTRVALAILPIR